MLGSERFFYYVHKSPPPVRNLRHMNADHKVTDNVPKWPVPIVSQVKAVYNDTL